MESIEEILKQKTFKKINHKTECDEIIYSFMDEINKERFETKLKPLSFMATKMKLLAIKDNKEALYEFLSNCKDYKNRKGSFSKYFFGVLKKHV